MAFAHFCAMMTLLLFLGPSISLVDATRDYHASRDQHQIGLFTKCNSAKCSDQTFMVKSGETLKFQDCKVKKNKPIYLAKDVECQETCTVSSPAGPQEVTVYRPSGKGKQLCREQLMSFMEDLEKKALTLTDSQYSDLSVMSAKKVKNFLWDVRKQVLEPEKRQAEGYGHARQISEEVKSLAIIGDLHGQLFNLIAYLNRIKKVYRNKGYKSLDGSSLLICDPKFQYVFMGDYVDRGERGIEVLLLLLAYKARCPQGLIILQGNHETPMMWRDYGFLKELVYKFTGKIGTIDEDHITSVTETFPYVAVAPGKFMMMHGGLTPDFAQICGNQKGQFGKCLTNSIAEESVWSDPSYEPGFRKSHRGMGYLYGMDVAKTFLKSNGLRGIFRGHEQVDSGYAVKNPDGIYFVATVFSAADYVGCFCEGHVPPFDREMFSEPGEGNLGAYVLADLSATSPNVLDVVEVVRMEAGAARKQASKFTGATCRAGLLETGSQNRGDPDARKTLGGFIQENHRRLGMGDNYDNCSLGQEEAASWKKKVEGVLSSNSLKTREFEARKLIDLQGEALIHGKQDMTEICKSMKRDHLTLQVYKALEGSNDEILKHDIKTREDELEQ